MTETLRTSKKRGAKPPLEAEVRLLDWEARGATAAQIEDRRVLVDRGIPGERILASVDRQRRPWRGVVVDVLEPSPVRASPPCPYYRGGCGGCQWQHIDYAAQVEAKRSLVDREMERCGVAARVTQTYAMDDPWRYRRTAALAVGWEAGFRPRGRRGIVEIHDCLISHPLIGRLADRLNDLLDNGVLPNYHGKLWLDCTVVGSDEDPRLQILLQGISGLTLDSHPELPEVARTLAEADPSVETVAYRHRTGAAHPLVGNLCSVIEVDGRPMYLPAGSFFQTNLIQLPRVISRMREEIRARDVRLAADVYGGVGTFALSLADDVEHMTLVELDEAAVSAARLTAQSWRLDNVELVSRHAERALPGLPALEAIIVDPPRSGLGETVTAAIAANGAQLVLYLSCAPASMARDLATLESAGYRALTLEVFDFYPQTYHIETLAVLERSQ